MWHGQVWLIDHGAALYFHHGWPNRTPDAARFAAAGYDGADHALAGRASDQAVRRAADDLTPRVTPELLGEVLEQVPDEWLQTSDLMPDVESVRAAYVQHLGARAASTSWLPAPLTRR